MSGYQKKLQMIIPTLLVGNRTVIILHLPNHVVVQKINFIPLTVFGNATYTQLISKV